MARTNKHISGGLLSARTVVSMRAVVTVVLSYGLMFSPASVSAYDNNNDATPTQSKRIEVYSLSQNYWDTQSGDTLGEIVLHLLPNNPSKHEALKQDIVHLNPQAFIGGDPSRLLAGKRLWLPGYLTQADTKADPENTRVESYSWGNIKRSK